MLWYKYFLGCALLIMCASLPAQTGDDQASSIGESWIGAGVNYKPNKSLTLGLEEQLRLKSKNKLYKSSFTELHAAYKLWNGLKAGIGYRYINSYDDRGKKQGSETHHRMHYRLSYKMGVHDDIDLGLRLQYQNRREQNAEDLPSQSRWRVRTDMDYNISNWKLDPRIAFEYLSDIPNEDDDGKDKYRISIGSSYKINGSMKLDFRYMFEDELSTAAPERAHVLRLNYTYTIKPKKKVDLEEPALKLNNDSGASQ